MEDKATLQELRERYFADRRWRDLADVLEREIRVTEDRDERLDLYEELGTVAADQLGDAARAYDAFRTVIDLRSNWSDVEAVEIYNLLLRLDPGFAPAFERLEEVLRARGDVESLQQLASSYIDFAAATNDPATFLRCQREASRIFETDLGQPDAALVILIATLTADTWQTGLIDDIERLAYQTGEWDEVVAKVSSILLDLPDTPLAGRLHKRLGLWLLDLKRSEEAANHLQRAFRHAPRDPELDDALGRVYRALGKWEPLIEAVRLRRREAVNMHDADTLRDQHIGVLREAIEHVADKSARARYLADLGTLHDQELNDRMTAVTLWEKALNTEPETLDAARPLIDYYLADNRWERAAPVLETVVKAAEANRSLLDPQELNQRYLQYGQVCDTLGNDKVALRAYRQAYELDRNNPRTLQRLGTLLYDAGEFDQAFHALIALIDRHERAIPPDAMLDALQKAADIKRRHSDSRVARGLLERALRLDPHNRETLRALADLGEETGDLDQAMGARQAMFDAATDPKVKYAELVKMGDVWKENARLQQAARCYVAALDLEPASVSVLRKLLETFRQMGRSRESIGVLDRLVDLEPDRTKRATLLYTMGIIARDETDTPERAVTHFDRALDENPELLKAFEAIDRILTDQKQWKELERAYRRMLHRVAANELELDEKRRAEVNFLLWSAIGEVYRSRLGQADAAVQAFETAQAIRPDDEKVRKILAELYTLTGANTRGAVEQHRKLIKSEPLRADSYHALYRAYMANREFDRAWCVAGTLYAMEKGDHEEVEFYRKYLGWNLKLARGTFYPELLNKVYPRDQNRVVNGIMAHLAVALRTAFSHPVKEYGVHPKNDLIDPAKSDLVIAQVYSYVAGVLGHNPAPCLYARRDHPLGIRILNSDPPAILIGSDMLEDREDDRALAFRLGKLLGWMRPEHYLAAIGNTPDQLTVMFVSAMDWVLGRKPSAGRDGAALIKQIKAMSSPSQMQLQSLFRVYLERSQEPPNMGQWVTAAEHATSRFGLILCNDVQKAVEGIRNEPKAMTAANPRQRVENLLAYAGSEAYSDVRKELGLAIG